jgi:hypothetical protein
VTAPRPDDEEATQAAVERYRDIAKWLITVFAAVGGVLVAGSQLTALGNLDLEDDRGRLLVALSGLAIAMAMAVVIVASALHVLEPLPLFVKDVVSDQDLAKELNQRPERLPFGSTSVVDLDDKLGTALRSPALSEQEKEGWRDEARRFIGQARVVKVRSRFRRAWRRMAWAAPLATVGIVVFAYAANPPESSSANADDSNVAVVLPAPTEVRLHLTPSGRTALGSGLGRECVRAPVPALTIGGDLSRPRVVVLPVQGCKPAQFVLSPSLGVALAAR